MTSVRHSVNISTALDIIVDLLPEDTRDGAAAARVAHNHEVPGSSPGPATKKIVSTFVGTFFMSEAKNLTWDRVEVAGENSLMAVWKRIFR